MVKLDDISVHNLKKQRHFLCFTNTFRVGPNCRSRKRLISRHVIRRLSPYSVSSFKVTQRPSHRLWDSAERKDALRLGDSARSVSYGLSKYSDVMPVQKTSNKIRQANKEPKKSRRGTRPRNVIVWGVAGPFFHAHLAHAQKGFSLNN